MSALRQILAPLFAAGGTAVGASMGDPTMGTLAGLTAGDLLTASLGGGGGSFNPTGMPNSLANSPGSAGRTTIRSPGSSDWFQQMAQQAAASGDPTSAAMIMSIANQQQSPLLGALSGLGPLANMLVSANILPKQIAPQAAATHGGAQQPGPVQPPMNAGSNFLQPIQTAQLLEALL